MTRQPAPAAMLAPGPIEAGLRREGFIDWYLELDAQVCAEVECECGAPRTRYIGLIKPAGGTVETMFGRRARGEYRAISHCDVCGLEVQF